MVTKAAKSEDIKCPVTATLTLIGGKWKPIILYCLKSDTRRFGELAARIPNLSRKVLTEQLKELELDGLVIREQFNEIPPRVEYSLSELGRSLSPVLNEMEKWGVEKIFNKRQNE
jgi:DNA-binding HxlR family transcriptional regulator